jgi:hypothetical protein
MGGSRNQVLVDLAATVLSEAVRSVERLVDDGVDSSEAIRLVEGVLASVTEAALAQGSDAGERQSGSTPVSDDRELGGES